MIQPLEIAFHNTRPVPDVETHIRQELAELEKYYNRIVSCRVDVEFPEHPRRGSVSKVRLELNVPAQDAVTPARLRGVEISAHGTERVEVEAEHKNASVAAHEAFTVARRRLEEFTGRQHPIA